MLPDALFSPLYLDAAIEDVEYSFGARGVVDLLVEALTDSRVRRDRDIDKHCEKLKSACRQTGRYRDAIGVFERIAVLNPARSHEVAAELALVHAHLGEPIKGIRLLEAAFAVQRRLPARRRSVAFCLVGELAATVLRHPALARELAALGQSTAQARPRVRSAARGNALDDINLLLADRERPRLALVRPAAAA